MTTIASFLARCDSYAAERQIARSYLSKLLFDDGKLIDALASQKSDITVRRLERATRTLGELERALAMTVPAAATAAAT